MASRARYNIFPVVMDGYENWTIKKAECQKIEAFELWCWRRLWRVPWTARIVDSDYIGEISFDLAAYQNCKLIKVKE